MDENPLRDDGPHLAMLRWLTDRFGLRGAPRLQVILMGGGSVWALKWLIDSGLLDLSSPLGCARRESAERGDHCGVCMENFLAPVVLHEVNGVRHEICRICAKDYFERRRKDHGEEEGSPCPYCKVMVPAPDVLPSNLVGILGEDLNKAAPWLEPPNAESWLVDTETPVGSVFAALAAYHGMLSVLELVATNTACDLHEVWRRKDVDALRGERTSAGCGQVVVREWIREHGGSRL